MNLILYDCNCAPDRDYVPGHTGEFYTQVEGWKYAAVRFRLRRDQDQLGYTTYWGVHFNGKHVMDVRDSL